MNLLKRITYKETFGTDTEQYKSVRVVLLDDENLIAVLYIGKVDFYTLPGGTIEKGETPEQAVIRETQEETGCDSEILCTLGIIEENSKTCNWNGINTCFLSKIKGKKGVQNLTQIESEEETQIRWYGLSEALKIISNQEISARNEREIGIGQIIQERDITLLNEVIKKVNIGEIKNTLGQMLDAKRLAHTFAVCDTAVMLAERFGADKDKAYLAALVHDCARGFDEEQLKMYCNEHGIELDDYMQNDINPVHALVGADMAKRRFGIDDEEILSAIKNHAVGCENMTLLDKIILVADAIEPNRTGSDADEARNAAENDIDEAIVSVMRIKSYYLQGKLMHPYSYMMLNKLNETKLYFDWIQKVCAERSITINGKMAHIKEGKLFCVSSSIGDLYLKKTGSFIIDELTFTLKLMEMGLINQPELVGYDHDMNVCLMRDMDGCDLSLLPTLDMKTALNMFISLSRLQKDSIQYVESKDFCGVDYGIGTMLEELEDLSETAYTMLSDTQYKITRNETEKLKRNVEHIKTVLKSIHHSCLPDTIHHGDLGTYNVRVIDGKSIFYDWGCGGASHPFFDTFRLLSSIRGKLPADVPAKEMIIDTYLGEWLEYGSREELKNIFTAIDGLAGFYMAYVKYIRTRDVHLLFAGDMEAIATHCLMPNNRYETASTYLKRFIANDF